MRRPLLIGLLGLLLACETPKEELPTWKCAHCAGQVTIGQVAQALDYLTVLSLRQGPTSRAMPVILAHGVASMYGFPFDESRDDAQATLLGWCRRFGIRFSTPWQCWKGLVARVTADARSALDLFATVPRYEKNALDLRTMLSGALQGEPFPLTPPVYMDRFSALMDGSPVKGSLTMTTIPEGPFIVPDDGGWRLGEEGMYTTVDSVLDRASTIEGTPSIAVADATRACTLLESMAVSQKWDAVTVWLRVDMEVRGTVVSFSRQKQGSHHDKHAMACILDTIRTHTFHRPEKRNETSAKDYNLSPSPVPIGKLMRKMFPPPSE